VTKEELWRTNGEITQEIENQERVLLTQNERLDELSGLNKDLHVSLQASVDDSNA